MNNIKSFFLDPYIIAILFKSTNDREINTINTNLQNQLIGLVSEFTKKYLAEKGISQDKITKFEQEADLANDDQEIQNLMAGKEYIDGINAVSESFGKAYFDRYFPELTPDEQNDIIEYIDINLNLKDIKENRSDEVKQAQKEVLEYFGVASYEELKVKLGIKDETKEVPQPVQPTINLGGVKQNSNIDNESIQGTSNAAHVGSELPITESVTLQQSPVGLNPVIPTPEVTETAPIEESASTQNEPIAPPAPFDWNELVMQQLQESDATGTTSTTPVAEQTQTATPTEQPTAVSKLDDLGVLNPEPPTPFTGTP